MLELVHVNDYATTNVLPCMIATHDSPVSQIPQV
jgi:hypothetical protein